MKIILKGNEANEYIRLSNAGMTPERKEEIDFCILRESRILSGYRTAHASILRDPSIPEDTKRRVDYLLQLNCLFQERAYLQEITGMNPDLYQKLNLGERLRELNLEIHELQENEYRALKLNLDGGFPPDKI